MTCDCMIHRYHVAHICECGQLISHSQGDCDAHRTHKMIHFDPNQEETSAGRLLYEHGDTSRSVFDKLAARGWLPYDSEGFQPVYLAMADQD